ncbi:hypothetical protein [Motilibacter deserti]|uniref:Uncharacterized protein n=1 Tax=Motilibacter deserti TaxID=2714956 RepID=A0ABX0GQB0_9ACTN|nr:hypothetical protein [Motilibacter deserti]NHC12892.1 hypothetical protein [Motilibacter deserti]
MSQQPDHELEELEEDSAVPPRPEEVIADAGDDQARSPGVQPVVPGAPEVADSTLS